MSNYSPKSVAYLVDIISKTSIPDRLAGVHGNIEIKIYDTLRHFLKDINSYDIVNTHHTKTGFFVSALYFSRIYKGKIKFFHTMHRDLLSMSTFKRFIYIHFILKNRDQIICNSHNTKKSIDNFINQKVSVVYNGIDEKKFYKKKNSTQTKDIVEIITTCRLIKSKRIDILIHAFKEYQKLNQNSFLKIIGDGPEKSKLEDLVNELPCTNVKFLGTIKNEDIGKYLRASDIFVTCSETEGFGNSTIEAYFCGLEVIVSDIAIHRELGNSEFHFFELNSIGSLFQAIANVAKKKSRKRSKNNLSYLSMSATTSKLIDTYNE